nr:class I tRNA ligase family protein [Zoogloea sp.]
LYTTAANSPARRSAQSALWHILQSVVRLMAPILSFTAEEIWLLLGKNPEDSVMLHLFHALPEQEGEEGLLARWTAIRAIRADVQKEIEAVRAAGQVGSSLQAEVEIRAAGDNFELLTSLGDDLRFVLICSKATVVQVASDADAAIVVTPSAHKKCERCWHYRDDVGHDAAHPELCGRCTSNLHGAGEARRVA